MNHSPNKYILDKIAYLPDDPTWFIIKLEGLDMQRINPYNFYQMGSILHPLSLVTQESKVLDIAWDLNTARSWLAWLLSGTLVTLIVSRSATQSLFDSINAIIPQSYNDFSSIDSEKKLEWVQWYTLTNSLKEFETVFAAELPTFASYIVSQKGIYSTADLIERAEMAIDEPVRKMVPPELISDFNQAGRCLAFSLPTAAGFHTMRAVEGMLRIYWRIAMGRPAKAKTPMMANCIEQLRKKKEDPRLMDILDHIRDLHRNTTMHPEAFLDMKDALRLFDIAKSAISAMGDRVNALKPIPPA
jgi:hypothetical protein